MNFLGHCLLTQYNPEFIAGNIGGDHFKGDLNNFVALPKDILKGVTIHRFIDSYTDSAEEIHAVAKIFQDGGVKRISYIASDIILDHFISQNWSAFSPIPLNDFIQDIYSLTKKELGHFPEKFHFIFNKMVEKDWLSRYIEEDGIELTLYKFEQRIPFTNNLHASFAVYKAHQDQINRYYHVFMERIMTDINKEFKLNVILP
ncbi:hypothetical protein DNU06_07395 [Putridiphycobacter roseus]|uniref:DUF479 domain-containing protein n=1 Tax=Putridiphycobacter roseus TaxID=2219161 RepID=A0A2W1NI91_9FLAO|nr:ACP phosphodiesterase [Putridiphycobacter roseus]PZE17646.1 hypothetical protein DNU06_07395 [Putridiphycobacter roseus]